MKLAIVFVSLATIVLSGTGCQTPATRPAETAPAAATTPPATPVSPATADAHAYLFGWGDVPVNIATPRGGSSRGAPVTLAPARPLPLAESAAAPTAFEKDRAAILSLAGDYKVGFHFLETIALTTDHTTPRPYHSWATEHVRVIEDTGRFVSLQHTLVMFFKTEKGAVSEPMLVKHWRQDWTFEDTDLHTFRGENTWQRRTVSPEAAAGAWTQAVFQVDDSPRYEALGRWEHVGNRSAWTGENAWRPLPRREHTVRKDYGVMEGRHRIVITPTGWLHEQDNWKRVAGDAAPHDPRFVGHETGLDRYDRIAAPSLAAADAAWARTGAYWALVRQAWTDVFARHDRFSLRTDVDGERLFEAHFAYAGKLEEGQPFDADDAGRHARETIARFVETRP